MAVIFAVTASLNGANQWSAKVRVRGDFNVSIAGTFEATVTVQRSYDDGAVWRDVEAFTAPVERVGREPEDTVVYRVGIKTGQFTSGQADVRISY